MVTRKIPFIGREFYHIYNRGNDKRIIFKDDSDYKRFILLLYLCNSDMPVHISNDLNQGLPLIEMFKKDRGEQFVDIVTYCLMPNHFHILIKEKTDGGISTFMGKLATAYVMYFNTKNERKGSLFEGPFGAKHIDTDEYLNWIFSYIHLNPVKLIDKDWKEKGYPFLNTRSVEDFIKNYKYSSYYDYFINNRPESSILNKDTFSENLSELNDFKDIVKEFHSPQELSSV